MDVVPALRAELIPSAQPLHRGLECGGLPPLFYGVTITLHRLTRAELIPSAQTVCHRGLWSAAACRRFSMESRSRCPD